VKYGKYLLEQRGTIAVKVCIQRVISSDSMKFASFLDTNVKTKRKQVILYGQLTVVVLIFKDYKITY